MKLKFEFEIVDMGEETVAVALENGANEFHGVVKLRNESSRFLFECLKEETDFGSVVEKCLERFPDSDKAEIEEYVKSFLDYAARENLLEGYGEEL